MKYKIIRSTKPLPQDAIDQLEEEVNSFLAEGWETVGGVSFSMSGMVTDKHSLCFAVQSMILRPANPLKVGAQ